MVFSGFTLEEVREMAEPAVGELIGLTDMLVDGPYVRELPDTQRRWIGSTNAHSLPERPLPLRRRWRESNTLEIRLAGGELTVNGFPARSAMGLWKRPRAPGGCRWPMTGRSREAARRGCRGFPFVSPSNHPQLSERAGNRRVVGLDVVEFLIDRVLVAQVPGKARRQARESYVEDARVELD